MGACCYWTKSKTYFFLHTLFPKKFQALYSHSLKVTVTRGVRWFQLLMVTLRVVLIAVYTESHGLFHWEWFQTLLRAFTLLLDSIFLSTFHEFPVSSFLPCFPALPPRSAGVRWTGFFLLHLEIHPWKAWASQLQKSSPAFCSSAIKGCPAQLSVPRRNYVVLASPFCPHSIWKPRSCLWLSCWVQTRWESHLCSHARLARKYSDSTCVEVSDWVGEFWQPDLGRSC